MTYTQTEAFPTCKDTVKLQDLRKNDKVKFKRE